MNRFVQIPVANLYKQLPKLKFQIRSGNLRVCITHQGKLIGFLVPLKDSNQLPQLSDNSIKFSKFKKFRPRTIALIAKYQEVVRISFNKRTIFLFVSGRLQNHLDLPLIGDPNLVIRGAS